MNMNMGLQAGLCSFFVFLVFGSGVSGVTCEERGRGGGGERWG